MFSRFAAPEEVPKALFTLLVGTQAPEATPGVKCPAPCPLPGCGGPKGRDANKASPTKAAVNRLGRVTCLKPEAAIRLRGPRGSSLA